MKILLPEDVRLRLEATLARAGLREIGGVLMGEAVQENTFRVIDFSVQYGGGTVASFMRAVSSALQPLQRFFERTARNYRRYNYLGEWHSHPSFSPEPSPRDHESMQEIVDDREVGANFAVLMVVKLQVDALKATVTGYVPGGSPFTGELILERQKALST